MLRKDLERLSRDELITRAEVAGVSRPRSLTTAELLDELVLRGDARGDERARARGWFGRAKDLLKSAIDRGLDRSEGARPAAPAPGGAARGPARSWPPAPPPPLPTVTLAEIYAAQGHLERAVQVLDEVLAKDPAHGEAARLRDDYRARIQRTVVRPPAHVPSVATGSRADVSDDRGAPTGARHGAARPDATSTARRSAGDAAAAAAADAHGSDARRAEAGRADARQADPNDADDREHDALDEEVDEVVAVAVDPSTIYLYWEIRPSTAARARVEAPGGALVVRAVAVTAGAGVPSTEVRDERVDALSGDRFVRGLRDGAHVRVSVGWLDGGSFVPLAVAAEVITPRRAPSAAVATHLGAWTPPPVPVRRGGDEAHPIHAAPGASPRAADLPSPPLAATRRTVLLQPAEVFEVPGSGPVPVGVWRPPGSSDLVTLYGGAPGTVVRRDARWGPVPGPPGASDMLHGGASDMLHGGASDLLVGASEQLVRR